MENIENLSIENCSDEMPLMELCVAIQSNVSIEIEQLVSELGISPTSVWIQKREHLRNNPHVASSVALYKCYSGHVQDIDTPVLEGLQHFLPYLQDAKKLCEKVPELYLSVTLEVKIHEDCFSPAYFLEPETIEMLNTYKTGFSMLVLDSAQS